MGDLVNFDTFSSRWDVSLEEIRRNLQGCMSGTFTDKTGHTMKMKMMDDAVDSVQHLCISDGKVNYFVIFKYDGRVVCVAGDEADHEMILELKDCLRGNLATFLAA